MPTYYFSDSSWDQGSEVVLISAKNKQEATKLLKSFEYGWLWGWVSWDIAGDDKRKASTYVTNHWRIVKKGQVLLYGGG